MTERITRSQTITAIDAKIASESTYTFQDHEHPIKERSAIFDDLVAEERMRCLTKEIKSKDIPTRLCVRFYRSADRMSKKTTGNKMTGSSHKGVHSETFSIGDTVEFRTNTGEVGVAVIIALYELDLAEDAHEDLPFRWGRFKARLHRFQVAGKTSINMHVQQRPYIPVRGIMALEYFSVHTRTGRNILLPLHRFGPHRSFIHSPQMQCQAQGAGKDFCYPFLAQEEDDFQSPPVQVTISWSPRCPFISVWRSEQCGR